MGYLSKKTKILLFENALECTSGRHVGAFYWVNTHQIMRDILRGALMESLILENASFVEKMNILLFENAWKGAWWAKKQFSNTESFQKCPPLRRGSVTHEDFLMLRVLMRLLIVNLNKLVWIISRRNRHVPAGDFARHSLWYPWKGYEHRWCEGITWQKKRVQWWLRWWFFLNEEKYKNYKSILGMLRARPSFSDRRKNRFFGRSRAFLCLHRVQYAILRKTRLWTPSQLLI